MIKRMILVSMFMVAFVSNQANAFKVLDCEQNLVDLRVVNAPVKKNVKQYYKNAVTVYNVNVGEPASSSAGIAVVLPDYKNEGDVMKCFSILGFNSIDITQAKSKYDENLGLLLTIPNELYNPESAEKRIGKDLNVRINLKNASVVIE